MDKVNYIVHLNTAFEKFDSDERIKQGHITLYLAFFQKWNREFFRKMITVNRTSIVEKAKFKSKTTYHNYLRDLNDWGYLNYFPSFHPARGSKIRMPIFGTTTEQALNRYCSSTGQKMASCVPEPGQNMVPSLKYKTKENFNKLAKPKNEQVVLSFFKENHWPVIEGRKFYAYYESKKWKLQRGLKSTNWKATAKNFIEKGIEIKLEAARPISGYLNNLRRNYDEPL